jgi:hypothetical protein
MINLVERLKFNGFSGKENVLHRTRRWAVERSEAAARIAELEAALKSVVKSVEDGVIMVRPSERDKFMLLLTQWNETAESQ